MKRYLHAFFMCQSMFCAIPCPIQIWDEEARNKMLLFLPVVGLEIGAIWVLLAWLCSLLHLPSLLTALILCVWPFLATGHIHLDGFMDVTDAVGSYRTLERRREILKDSHVGSFAVIGVCLLLLTQFALFASLPQVTRYHILLLIPAVSRCCSALSVALLKPMSTSQYAQRQVGKGYLCTLVLMLVALLVAGFLFCGTCGIALVGCLLGYALALRKGYQSLDGMNGDISGYALTLGELCAVAVFVFV